MIHNKTFHLKHTLFLKLKRTALHRASLGGHTAVVEQLLEKGADINFKDQVRESLVCKDDYEIG